MGRVAFIADFFAEHILGGGEINNEEVINILNTSDRLVTKHQSHLVTADFINSNLNCFFIVGNFINLPPSAKEALIDAQYLIYEHDHKYLINRNPALYENFCAPREEIVNYNFYKRAKAVLCQSSFHKEIVEKNLKLDNIVSLGGNLWSTEHLDLMETLAKTKKLNKYSIMQSSIPHKNTAAAVRYCKLKNLEYELIPSLPYIKFLERLGANANMIFFPQTPETLSRIVVEARMMGMGALTNNLIGATKEEWFKLKGLDLIDVMRAKRSAIAKTVESYIENSASN